ncbi:proline-rich protein 18-like [Entelurus aequoreus]|uniref:proline-rich protein 18-like n=1 Tax=Entelurus aequoreus TaxID=161455 RepID=UPI002B1D20AE|nr:proline-rich protein 18-like [Entelurus aequoreus]
MAQHASRYLAFFTRSFPALAPFSFLRFRRKTELLAYLVLCVSKMPFIPPVSLARSVSGLTGKDKDAADKTKASKEDKGTSVKERLALNLKQLGKKTPPRSHLPTARGPPGAEQQAKKKGLPSESVLACAPGASMAKTHQRKHANSIRSEPDFRSRTKTHPDETRFTLTLTPEAVLLLQRRDSERRSAAAANNAGVPANAPDPRRRRDPLSSKRHPASAPQRHSAPAGRRTQCDASAVVKVSLLNERHKYDDVEYEDERDGGVDEGVVLKCTEWLRGLENTPVSVALKKSASSLKSF